MLIGVIADDFTGGSDIANTLAKGTGGEGGLATAQYAGVPALPASPDVQAGVVSLKSRSLPAEKAVELSLCALAWLLEQGCQQIIFKYCSTFDSTPQGNIGPVADALSDALNTTGVIVCPAFPTAGRTVYQGHLFVNDALLSESGMQHHPLTPMTDPDLRRWLGLQTKNSVGHLPRSTVSLGPTSIRGSLAQDPSRFVVADAVSDQDLLALGKALDGAPLVTGGSGIALGLPRNFIRSGVAQTFRPSATGIAGPEAILAGSCSGATRGQVEVHAQSHPSLSIDVPGVMSGEITSADLVAFIQSHVGHAPLAYSSGTPEDVRDIQGRYGCEAVAETLDALFADAARRLLQRGYRRIVVAGGETSGAVAQAVADEMKSPDMRVGSEIDPGVPVLTVGQDAPVSLALKSGNFGAPDFFAKALRVMEGNG